MINTIFLRTCRFYDYVGQAWNHLSKGFEMTIQIRAQFCCEIVLKRLWLFPSSDNAGKNYPGREKHGCSRLEISLSVLSMEAFFGGMKENVGDLYRYLGKYLMGYFYTILLEAHRFNVDVFWFLSRTNERQL